MNIIVCKFGGSSTATAEKIRRLENIIELNPARRCIVLSAPGKAPGITIKITDLLILISKKAIQKENYSKEVEELKKRYIDIYSPLGVSKHFLDDTLSQLDIRLKQSSLMPADKFRDYIVALGEDFNALLFAEYLISRGKSARYLSPQEAGLYVTHQFGNAQPCEGIASKMAKIKKFCADSIVIFPGFYGVTSQGDIATFSRGGSDLSGSILAEAVDAHEYENWTDVDGIFSAHPSIIENPMQIPALTYKEMRELSYIGFEVLHEEAVRPVMRKKIPIRLRNTNNLDNPGTLIVAERLPSERDVVGIASSRGYCSFTIQKYLMNREKGFGRRLLSIFEQMNLSYEHCPSGVDNISIVLDQSQLKEEHVNNIIRSIEQQLKPDEIRTEFGISLVAVVGEGLLHKIGVLAEAAGALARAGVNIKMVNQGSSEISMIFGIDSADEKKAVRALYEEFFLK